MRHFEVGDTYPSKFRLVFSVGYYEVWVKSPDSSDFDQQMYMVRFTPELQECATPPFQYFREGFAQVIQQFRCQGFAPVFGYEYDMQLERIDRMR